MHWKLFASTFALVFLAEIGDKTQLAALAVLAGETLTRVVPAVRLRRIAGGSFLVLGVLFLASQGE